MKFLNRRFSPENRKSQASLEYLMVASVALLMLVPIMMSGWESTAELNNNINFQKARNAVSQIADAAKTVYFQGTPSAITINVVFPDNIILSNASGKEIYFKMRSKNITADVVEFLDFNVTGNLSTAPGLHEIYLEALPNVVNITQKS